MKTKFYTHKEDIEEKALSALKKFEDNDLIDKICVFPDIHFCSEKSIPVGVSFKTSKVFFPLITGKDMGCGVAYLKIDKKDYLKPFDNTKHYRAFERESKNMTDEVLGGGNHFHSIEESDKFLYVIVHTGSRNLGIHKFQENLQLINDYHGYNSGNEWLPIETATTQYICDYVKILDYATLRRIQFLEKTKEFLIRNGYIKEDARSEMSDSIHNLLTFHETNVIHRKGSTMLLDENTVVIPLSMSRGCLLVKANVWDENTDDSLYSCSHGAGRLLSRTDTLKHWHSLKKTEREYYEKKFPELLNRQGKFDSSLIQEFDFAYKKSDSILTSQPYLIKVDETKPIATVKFTAI